MLFNDLDRRLWIVYYLPRNALNPNENQVEIPVVLWKRKTFFLGL